MKPYHVESPAGFCHIVVKEGSDDVWIFKDLNEATRTAKLLNAAHAVIERKERRESCSNS